MNPTNLGREPKDTLDNALTFLYQTETPQAFEASWRAAVRREENVQIRQKSTNHFWKIALPSFAAVVLVIGTLITGANDLGGQKSTDDSLMQRSADSQYLGLSTEPELAEEEADYGMQPFLSSGATDTDSAPMAGAGSATLPTEKKIVRTADMRLATTTFDQAAETLRDRVSAFGGTIENLYQYGDGTPDNLRSLSLNLRIPTEKLDEFLTGAADIGRVTVKSESATDMTVQYSDTSLQLQTQRDKMVRLQQLLAQAETVSDLLEIENEIANTQYQIDSYETSLRSIDRQVTGSLVTVTLVEETPAQSAAALTTSIKDRMASGLTATLSGVARFFQNMLVFVVMSLPIVLPLLIVGVGIWLVIRIRRKSPRKETKKS